MKPKNHASVWLCAMLWLALAGCQQAPQPIPAAMRDHVTPLLDHPEFPAAARAAPAFTEAAIETVIRLSKPSHE